MRIIVPYMIPILNWLSDFYLLDRSPACFQCGYRDVNESNA
jgi:hypothetical protein